MKPFDKCPACGGEIATKDVEKRLTGGAHSATVRAFAEVCLSCGERFYSVEDAERFEEAGHRLARGQPPE